MGRTTYPAERAIRWLIATSLFVSLLIWWGNESLREFKIIAQSASGPRLYPWQLAEPSFWSRASAWVGYGLHQTVIWALIYHAQRRRLTYTKELKTINFVALSASALFVMLHFIQTKIFYDGLAQDVPEWTAMTSVILLLLVVILIENQRRGITFGKKWGGYVAEAGDIARRYHGYYFAWATIYTFWYHPMIFTPGHAVGFFYMFLLLSQGALFFTHAHLNKWWTLLLELLVLVHGVLIAALHVGGSWQMFGFGLAGVFVITQLFGLGLSNRRAWIGVATYAAIVAAFYSGWGWADFPRVLRILVGYYAVLPVLAIVIVLLNRYFRKPLNTR